MTDTPKKPKEQPKPLTATERIAALDMQRFAGNGYIIAPPAEITRASALAWMQRVSEAGSAGDVEIAWTKGVQDIYIKRELRNAYDALHNAAGKRYHVIELQAAAEQEAERTAWLERTRKANRAQSIARLQSDIARLKAN